MKKYINNYYDIKGCFSPQTKGAVSGSITQNWTEQAIECYKLKCNCEECSLGQGNYSFVCQMPKILKILIKMQGTPNI